MLIRRLLRFLFVAVALFLAGACGSLPPPSTPTAAPSPIPSDTPTASPTATLTEAPLWTDTPEPTDLPLPTVPTETPVPPTATIDLTARPIPVVTVHPGGVITVLITEDQLNAGLASRFAAAPITNYTVAPQANLSDGSLDMTMQIVPLKAPPNSNPLTVTLTLTLAATGGALDIQPTLLVPLNAGVTARQVKLGQALLFQTLTELVAQAVTPSTAVTYTGITIQPDSIEFSLVKAA